MDGTEIPADWTGTLATGSVVLTDVNETAAAAGTAEAIAAATEKLEKGEIHVFDCSTFTVKGETLTSYQLTSTPTAITPPTPRSCMTVTSPSPSSAPLLTSIWRSTASPVWTSTSAKH